MSEYISPNQRARALLVACFMFDRIPNRAQIAISIRLSTIARVVAELEIAPKEGPYSNERTLDIKWLSPDAWFQEAFSAIPIECHDFRNPIYSDLERPYAFPSRIQARLPHTCEVCGVANGL